MKRCVICGEPAKYSIKDTNDYYCKDCADENFSDLSVLSVIEGRAKILKKIIDKKVNDLRETDIKE